MSLRRIVFFTWFLLAAGFLPLAQGPTLMLPVGHANAVLSAEFSPDGKKIITVSADGTAKLWETSTGKLLKDFKAGGDASISFVRTAVFVPGGNKILISYEGGQHALLMDVHSGESFEIWNRVITPGQFTPDGKKMILADVSADSVYSSDTYQPVALLKKEGYEDVLSYSPDGKRIISASSDSTVRLWDAATMKPLTGYKKQDDIVYSVLFSPDSKHILLSRDHSAVIVNAATLQPVAHLKSYISRYGIGNNIEGDETISFSPDGKKLIQLANAHYRESNDESFETILQLYDSATIWDIQSGNILYRLSGLIQQPRVPVFSPDGKKIILTETGNMVNVRDAMNGKALLELKGHKAEIFVARFSNDGRKIVTGSLDKTIRIWDGLTGTLINEFAGHTGGINDVRFNKDGKRIITASADRTARIWNAESGEELLVIAGKSNQLLASLTEDGKNIQILSTNGAVTWDITQRRLTKNTSLTAQDREWLTVKTNAGNAFSPDSSMMLVWAADIIQVVGPGGEMIFNSWSPEKEIYNDVRFSPDGKKLLATTQNNTLKIFDIATQKNLLTFISIDSLDFLVTDPKGHYDGTEAARKLIHFTCGEEIIELDQVKDQLWVPNLAERIMNGEPVNARSLDELAICGLTPLVEQGTGLANEYLFKIKPRRGGLGETVLSINGTPTNIYPVAVLKKTGAVYELRIKKEELRNYFIEGQENILSLKSFTANNVSSSRNLSLIEDPDKEKRLPPNLYAVMVGVSDYKGDHLDLDYAAIDAHDMSAALSGAAKKLLGDDHVFMYNLTTDSVRYLLPEKNGIKKVFEEIGKKAKANDILFIFLSGHGVVAEKNKQFYYLAADASSAADENTFADVGIGTAELTDWIKPQNIKAQKRILILDACYSGGAINSFVKMGGEKQGFLAARGDEKSQQLRAIDKLNEKTGLFILSASSSDQKAFESGIYSHGYLTYSLLKAIKLQPDILKDGKFLDVGRWLDAAGESVSEMAKTDGSKQQPQIISSTNFTIGIVDDEVTSKINLSETKALFTSGNFLNSDDAIADDDLDLRKLTDNQLLFLSGTAGGKKIFFLASGNAAEAYSLTGSYTVKENSVAAKINLKQNKTIKTQFSLTGTKDKLPELADSIIARAMEWIAANK